MVLFLSRFLRFSWALLLGSLTTCYILLLGFQLGFVVGISCYYYTMTTLAGLSEFDIAGLILLIMTSAMIAGALFAMFYKLLKFLN